MQKTDEAIRRGENDAMISLGEAYNELDREMQRRVMFALEEIAVARGCGPG